MRQWKIDDHLHLALEKQNQLFAGNVELSDGEEMLPHLKKLGIEMGILMASCETGEGPGSNESNRLLCGRFPETYRWMCNLDETDPDTVEDRLRANKEKGAVGIGELMINRRLDHPFLRRIFEAAQELHMPVLFHMSPEEGFGYGVVDLPGLPLLEQTLRDFPQLVVIGHSQPFWHEISKDADSGREARNSWGNGPVTPGGRLTALFETFPNLYGDLSANSGGCAVMRDEAFGLWFLERFQDQLLFGTDMVNRSMEFPLGGWLDRMREEGKLSPAAWEKICRGNAIRLFGLETDGSGNKNAKEFPVP